jgi:hypothetical protein
VNLDELVVGERYIIQMYWDPICEVTLIGKGTGQPQYVGKVLVRTKHPGPGGRDLWMADAENLHPLEAG